MKRLIFASIIFTAICAAAVGAPQSKLSGVKWQKGPAIGKLGNVAEIQIPAGFVFAGGEDTRTLLEANHNPTSGNELGFISSVAEDWFVVFEYDPVGYVKDDEKNSLNADAMLKSIQKGNEAANRERERRGWSTMSIVGWEVRPQYNEQTHNLEWAIRGQSGKGGLVVNHNTKILGRGGVMEVTLVVDPPELTATLPKFRKVMDGFTFSSGNRYAEYRQGDKMAEYGLTALVVGGAAAVAVKTGLFKYLWKIIVIAFVAISGLFKKLFGGKSRSQY